MTNQTAKKASMPDAVIGLLIGGAVSMFLLPALAPYRGYIFRYANAFEAEWACGKELSMDEVCVSLSEYDDAMVRVNRENQEPSKIYWYN